MRQLLASLVLGGASLAVHAQTSDITRMEPPFWWAGMQHAQVQLMVYGDKIADLDPSLAYPGVRIASVTRTPNRNYLFIDLALDPKVKPGSFDICLLYTSPSPRD